MSPQQAELLKPDGEALVKRAPEASTSLMTIIDRMANSPDFDVVKLQAMLDVKERWDASEARKAFVNAMNAFKRNPPTINKNKHVEFGNTKYDHATLDHVTEQITTALSQHGISHRWDVEQHDKKIKVTCILTHEMGHSERTALEGESDNSGSKNPIQAIASAVTYMERYTLLAATGLAARGTDDDGRTAARLDDLNDHIEYIQNARNVQELQQLFNVAKDKAKAIGDLDALRQIIAAKDAKKKALQ